MTWLLMWIGLLIVSVGVVVVSASSLAVRRGVAADMRALDAATHEAQSPPVMRFATPAPVARYLALAGAERPRRLVVRHERPGAVRRQSSGLRVVGTDAPRARHLGRRS